MNSLFYESEKRGTPDFPIEFYHVEPTHPRYMMRTQWHNDIEIDRVLKGKLKIRLNDEQFELLPGDSVVIPGGVVHSAEGEGCVYECIVFPPTVLYATPRMRTTAKSKLKKPVFLKRDESIDELFENFLHDDEGDEFRIVGSLYGVMQKALCAQKSAPELASEYGVERIKPAISYIEENYMCDIPLSKLAEVCSMSPNYFCRFFRDATGHTPGRYITASRLEAACANLLRGMSVTESALACGFNDVSYFIRVFKKEMALSPKKYAEKNRHGQE